MFIGIGLPEECRDAVAGALSPLAGRKYPVSWTRRENLHLTLRFLGEVEPGRVEELRGRMSDAARPVAPFDLLLEGAGGFPSLRSSRVLWIGVREPLDPVRKLHQNMENALSLAGFPREAKAFHPHVTVGRVRKNLPSGFAEAFAGALAGKRFGPVRTESFQLYESRLAPSGAVYTVRVDVPFGAGAENTG